MVTNRKTRGVTMPNNKLTFLTECQTEFEAEIIRSTLERSGIESYLINGATATTLSYIGSAIGGTQVHVLESDLPRARQLAEQRKPGSSNEAEWYCTHCDEEQGSAFDVCWKCGQDRASVGRTISPESNLESEFKEQELLTSNLAQLHLLEHDVVRAWRASLFGVVSLPVILHLYSAYLLVGVALSGEKLPIKTRWMFWGATIIDIAVIVSTHLILRQWRE